MARMGQWKQALRRMRKDLVTGLIRAGVQGGNMALFFLLMSVENWPLRNLSRTLATTLLTWGAMSCAMLAVFGPLRLSLGRRRQAVAGEILGCLITDAVTYLQLQIMNVNAHRNAYLILFGRDFGLLLVCVLLQTGLILLAVTGGTRLLGQLEMPKKALLITASDCQPNLPGEAAALLRQLRTCPDWTISSVCSFRDPGLTRQILRAEMVFLSAAIPGQERSNLIRTCVEMQKDVLVKANLGDVLLSDAHPMVIDDAAYLSVPARTMSLWQSIAKRGMDILVSLVVLGLFWPVMAVIALLIRVVDGQKPLFRQKRMTGAGRTFSICKFRTMRGDQNVSARAGDERITPLGAFLRRWRLDELPQFFNILKGDMSLVGPRPEMLENVLRYKQELPEFVYREQMKAGLTGFAQIEGRYTTSPEDKLMLDMLYIRGFSLWLDVKLLLRTLTVFVRPDATQGFPGDDPDFNPLLFSNNLPEKKEEPPMHQTLLIMAAGLGSRYGGNKQIDRIGPNGEMLLEYSIYDAIAAGFDKVVFVIKRSMADTFREMIGDKIARKVEVVYAFQEFDSLPDGFVPPEGRTKPYGTVHAVLAAKEFIHEPFAVINADDYYGKDAFLTIARSLQSMRGKERVASMVAYQLKNTVSENGTVTRGVCQQNADGQLVKVEETYKIRPFPDGTIRETASSESGTVLPEDSLVSMNFWGLTPWFFEAAERDFTAFLRDDAGDPMKKEFVLPTEIDRLMRTDGLTVDVLSTDAVWFGVTYREDKPFVAGELKKLHEAGAYPDKL